jgi:hypothetical protein
VPDAAFSSIDLVFQCLVDPEKLAAFERAIARTVRPGSKVLDLGTGSGILAMLAAKAGATVVAIEFDPYIAATATRNVRANDLDGLITVVEADARSFDLKGEEPFDVVLMELITTALIDEDQVEVAMNLWSTGQVDSHTVFLPSAQETYVTLGEAADLYGFRMPMVRHLWHHIPHGGGVHLRSDPVLLSRVEFNTETSPDIATSVRVVPFHDCLVDCVVLSSVSELLPDVRLADTYSMNGPVAVPIEPVIVTAGTPIDVSLSYGYGGGFESMAVSLIPV